MRLRFQTSYIYLLSRKLGNISGNGQMVEALELKSFRYRRLWRETSLLALIRNNRGRNLVLLDTRRIRAPWSRWKSETKRGAAFTVLPKPTEAGRLSIPRAGLPHGPVDLRRTGEG